MFYNHLRVRGNLSMQFYILLILSIISLLLSCKAEIRSIDGTDNNLNNSTPGTPEQNFQMKYPPEPFFGPDGDSMIKTPSDIVDVDPKQQVPKCTDPLPADTYPMPRCISNIVSNYRLDQLDVKKAMNYRSKRLTSHLATFFAQFISYDISHSKNHSPSNHKFYIPLDDAIYNSYNSVTSLPGQLNNSMSLPFNRSDFLPPPTTQTPKRTGFNHATPFLDLSPIYGVTAENAKSLRDGNRGKLKTSGNVYDPYPFKDLITGSYILGPNSARSNNVFTMAIHTIWLREHNRLCNKFYEKYGDTWTDDQYFEEARKWNIAFYQRVVTEEYLGTVLGKPLPPYQKYDPDLAPGIDVFFSTITFRYGHSELSDFFQIQDEYGDSIVELSLQNTLNVNLLEKFGVASLLRSISLQRQEDVDIYYSDATRNVKSHEPNTYDLVAFDVLRARDRGIALYNNVRQAYGLEKKDSWKSITSVTEIQEYLHQLYPNGTDQLEAFVGAMAEDHLNGSNFGELLSTSMVTQFMNIRNSDRFWWENKENNLFTDMDRTTQLRDNSTFRDIIMRNLDDIFKTAIPQNIWSVQPTQKSFEPTKYHNQIVLSDAYIVGYEISGNNIYFQVHLLTTDGNAWFGMGFDPDNNGMSGADFVIGTISNGNISSLSNYRSALNGYNPPILDGDDSDLKVINYKSPGNDNFAIIEFSRPLVPNGRKGIRHGITKYILAYNPASSVLSYHQNNRQLKLLDFYNFQFSTSISNGQRLAKLAHGLGMFFTWCVLFPASIYIVRYYKHTNNYIKTHRFAQLLGGISIGSFGAAAMATISAKTSHSWLGLSIYVLLFLELGLGLISIWGQVSIVSVNQGYPRFVKRIHRFFGFSLLMSGWINVYLGIETYCLSYGVKSLQYRVGYLAWIVLLIISFIFGEYWWKWKGNWKWRYTLLSFQRGDEQGNENDSIISHIKKEDLDKLPEFTWSEINERVQRGAYLVVCDGFIFNMRKWIMVHPGGAKILERVIGTDITKDFFGYKGNEIIEHIINVPAIKSIPIGVSSSILGQYTDILRERTKTYTSEKNSVAQVVDVMNLRYFLKAPLAVHPHSLYAIKKLASMVMAKLKEDSDVEPLMSPMTFGPTEINVIDVNGNVETVEGGANDLEIAKQDSIFRIKFRRYKLTSKSPINGSKKYPAMKFTFTIVHQNENQVYNHKLKFLPGHYIEVQSRIKGQVVIRSYTPIEGNISQSFSIFVKVYPDGLMSQHLNEQLKGYEIQVRGPFDVGDREVLQTSSLFQTADLSSLYRRTSTFAKGIPSFISSSKSSLLNPNTQDGHWKELYMICGGTGVTPMFQLITYHLELCMRRSHASTLRNKKVSMHLLYGNNTIEDIINGVELEEYRLSSRGMLTVTYALDKPNSAWTGENGGINQEMILDWLSKFVINDNKGNSSSGSGNNNDNNNNYIKTRPNSLKKDLSYIRNKRQATSMIELNGNRNATYLSASASQPFNDLLSPTDDSDNDINTNKTNSRISTISTQPYSPLSYGASPNNNDNNNDNIPLHSKPLKMTPSIMSNNQNTYKASINPESTLSHNHGQYFRKSVSSTSPTQKLRFQQYKTVLSPPPSPQQQPHTFNNDINDSISDSLSVNNDDSKENVSDDEIYSDVTIPDNFKGKSKLNLNSKIIVCGQPGMINIVEQTLKNHGYTEDDFILIT